MDTEPAPPFPALAPPFLPIAEPAPVLPAFPVLFIVPEPVLPTPGLVPAAVPGLVPVAGRFVVAGRLVAGRPVAGRPAAGRLAAGRAGAAFGAAAFGAAGADFLSAPTLATKAASKNTRRNDF
ncbi:MAG: hypothetical protein ACLPHP_23805 [Candidatus Sulfotelmatobacter sp.]